MIIESNPEVPWHLSPPTAYPEGCQHHSFQCWHPQTAGTLPDFILTKHLGTGSRVAFSKLVHVTAQLKTHHPYNRIQVHLQDSQNPTWYGLCLVFEPSPIFVPHWSSNSSSNSLSSVLPQGLCGYCSLFLQVIMKPTRGNPGPDSNIKFSERPSLTSLSNVAPRITPYH